MRYYDTYSSHMPWLFTVLLLLLVLIVLFISSCNSSNTYNNGICKLCGGHYKFFQAVGHQFFTNYLYKCDKCGNIIEVNQKYHVFDLQ